MAYMYPYGDTQQLNLAWFLAKFKELYEYVMQLDPSGETAVDAILSRFTEQYDSARTYIPGDYTIYDGYIYKANTTTGGTFDSSAWDAALPVNDIQGLRILLGGLSTDLDALEQNAVTNVQYTPGAASADGLLRQTKNGAAETVMTVDKEPTENSQNPVKSGAVYEELDELKGSLTLYNSRGTLTMDTLTDSWLLSANSGQYQVQGGDRTNSFLADVDSNYGVLTVEFADDTNASYGYIIFHGTNGHLFYRDFNRIKSSSTITWRTTINRIATYVELTDAVNPSVETITASNVTSGVNVTCKKKGHDVRVDCGIASATTVTFEKTNTGTNQTIIFATLPESARPPANVYFPCIIRKSGATTFDPVNLYGVIYANGNIGITITETISIVQMILGQTYFTA